jgi:hypothetical protein
MHCRTANLDGKKITRDIKQREEIETCGWNIRGKKGDVWDT